MKLQTKFNSITILCSCKSKMSLISNEYICDNFKKTYGISKNICKVNGELSSNGKMNREAFKTLFSITKEHFWFIYRNEIINDLIKDYFKDKSNIFILDIGCGDCNVLNFLYSQNSKFNLFGIDIYSDGFEGCNINIPLFQANVSDFLFEKNQFDVILLLDVIEHEQNDKK